MGDINLNQGTFGYDLEFLSKHQSIITLTAEDDHDAKALVVAGYQGRVMTSTATGDGGNSYGWVNYRLIESGAHQPHMNAFGGEERFWLSPEGGQFSVYFKNGDSFDFENWQTPSCIDSLPFSITELTNFSASFHMEAELENHSGTKFSIAVNRTVLMLDKQTIFSSLGIDSLGNCKSVAYSSTNEITNNGSAWKPETGMIGIWLLGMFKPSDKTVIIAPYTNQHANRLMLTDNYFGKIPSERLIINDAAVLLMADGKYRSKIGLAPHSATNVAGSYDAENGLLTIIQYGLNRDERYLKSTWEMHDEPYKGDVFNAYNDGKLDDGTQMGPFYELESSSSTRELREGEKLVHNQKTYHFEGEAEALNEIALQVLNVQLDQIGTYFW
ncbi:MAG TPA: DUF6786 family protein [Dyadobacter sp.]|jgi:hypothetical protein|nr:DUF6786 family protein [Dyadobacter sp.]